jgi:hypothetical protein
MVNRSKIKGTAYETAVVNYLQQHGFPNAERRALRGSLDCGDIAGIPDVVMELKATREITLAAFMDETAVERRNAGARIGVAVVKRRQRSTGESYVIMELSQFVEMIRD